MLYFVPNVSGFIELEALKKLGLGHAFESAVASRSVDRGPQGQSGILVSRQDTGLVYHPDSQIWRKLPGLDIWFGWTHGAPAENYARLMQAEGEYIRLADGNDWLIPAARDFDNGGFRCALPVAFGLSEDGKTWTSTALLPKYQKYWDSATALAQKWVAVSQPSITYTDMFDFGAEGLALNYYLGRLEIGVMGLFTTEVEVCRSILDAAFARRKYEDYLKKNRSNLASSNDGDAA